MDTVLVAVTDHDRWTRTVASVVADTEDSTSTEAVVVHQFTKADLESTVDNLNTTLGGADVDELAARKSGVGEVVDRLEQEGIECSIAGVETTDTDGQAVLAAADDADADRIYMYSRKRSPAGKAIFGSDLQHVLLNATVPVVVVPSNIA